MRPAVVKLFESGGTVRVRVIGDEGSALPKPYVYTGPAGERRETSGREGGILR